MAFDVPSFVSGLVVHFGEPKFDVPDADKKNALSRWLKDMVRNLGGFNSGVLEKACEIIIATRKYRSFPSLYECKEACIDAQEWLDNQRLAIEEKKQPKVPPQWAPTRFDMADQLIQSPLGRRAAKEGWILSLHDFCRNHLRLPEERHVIQDDDPRVRKSSCATLSRWKQYYAGDTVREIDECVEAANSFEQHFRIQIHAEGAGDGMAAALVRLGDSMNERRERLRALVLEGVVA